ncbi:uncharacterized protein LOC132746483 [Ruditapes philippinarum]|uniref:uncharacterized protein LOC132746483 n=1 Tax=Ruditapes philippinarum TaxID=129788 RepID=UPI00295B9AFA|nr:uncharacterized protein LOC132746483 [Ruditapes philippinarum]
MNVNRLVVLLISMVTLINAETCYFNACQETGKLNTKCLFTIACKTEGKFAKCNISGLAFNKIPPLKEGSSCIAPAMVPGFKDYCYNLLNNFNSSQPAPANVQNDDGEDDTTTGIIRESKTLVDSGNCFGTTILVSIAIGCFLAGGFIMWIIMFCCKLCKCCVSRQKEAVIVNGGHGSSNWNHQIHDRPIGSTSSAQLLGNASVESMSTNNTLLSNGDSPPFHDVATLGRSTGSSFTDFQTSQNRFEGQRYRHIRSPSDAWAEKKNAFLPNTRAQSAQWNVPRQSTLPNIPSQTSAWARTGGATLPNSQSSSVPWNTQGLSGFMTEHSSSAPWLDTIYSPASESSSRDYQSIQGGSDNPYAPCSESSSDYSAPHRVMIIRDGEIYQASSESSGSNNDYTSLKGQRFSRLNDAIYYPTSEGSNKDYASLLNERDANEATEHVSDGTSLIKKKESEDSFSNKSFNVSGLTFPVQASCRSNLGWTSNLEEIHEYETVDATRKDGDGNACNLEGDVATIADMCDVNHNTETSIQPHEYFKLEPFQSENI